MRKIEDEDTRYYIDLDLRTFTVLGWDYDHKYRLAGQDLEETTYHRIFISKGQFNKLEKKYDEVSRQVPSGSLPEA